MRLPNFITKGLLKFANWSRFSYFDLPGYMLRHYCLILPFMAIRKHTILRSDNDRHLHNHPFPSISIILKGAYLEVMPYLDDNGNPLEVTYLKVRRPGDIIVRKADDYHRIICYDGPVETLFITGKKSQDWGFLVNGKFIHNKDYIDQYQ